MVNAQFFRAARACLTMCPVVMCGGERGDGRALASVSFVVVDMTDDLLYLSSARSDVFLLSAFVLVMSYVILPTIPLI